MLTTFTALLSALGLFVGVLLCLEAGLRFGSRRRVEYKDGPGPGFITLGGAVFALLGLLMAFSFSGAAGRFEAKKHLIVDEATAIGTAYLRIDLLPEAARPAVRERFPRYVDARLAVYAKLPDMEAAAVELGLAAALQQEIWDLAVPASRLTGTPAAETLVVASLNAMFDISTTRTAALYSHAPGMIFSLLAVVSLVCAFLAGFDASGRKTRSWVHAISFAAILAAAFYVILDLEYPRVGLIRLSSYDQVMLDVRQDMDHPAKK